MQEIAVYDSNMQYINNLVQWDQDVYIKTNEPGINKNYPVHFFNNNSKFAYVVESTYVGGILTAKIPNEILRSALPITGYIYVSTGAENEHKSIYVFRILVRERKKPSDIVFKDNVDYINLVNVLAQCKQYSESASKSASSATSSASAAKTSETKAASSAETATTQATTATNQANNAVAQAKTATEKAVEANNSALLAQSYTSGGTNVREGENTDNAAYYYEQLKAIFNAQTSGAIVPFGTVAFEALPSLSAVPIGAMYNISNDFTTTSSFAEGSGKKYPAGTNVYKIASSQWDVFAGSYNTLSNGEIDAMLV